jgi:hypothetical protein
MSTEGALNSMTTSAFMSSMFSSTLNPSELEDSKVLNKFEKLKDLTIFGFVRGLVSRRSMFKPKIS